MRARQWESNSLAVLCYIIINILPARMGVVTRSRRVESFNFLKLKNRFNKKMSPRGRRATGLKHPPLILFKRVFQWIWAQNYFRNYQLFRLVFT